MRHTYAFVLLALVGSQAANAASPLDGKWVLDPRHCAFNREEMIDTETAADNITIKNNRWDAYESACRILATQNQGPAYSLKMSCSAEGSKIQQTMRVKLLAPDRMTIGGTTEVYQRCGPTEAKDLPIKLPQGVPQKILFGAHAGDATVLGAKGMNTDEAMIVFARRPDDLHEDCERNYGGDPETLDAKKVIEGCVVKAAKAELGKSFSATADCSTRTISSSLLKGGPYQLAKAKKADGFVDTDWRNEATGKLTGNCSACDTPHIESVLAALCPRTIKELCAGISTPGSGSICSASP